MRPGKAILRLVRYSPGSFAALAFYATIIHGLVPIPIGLATRAFFDALAGKSAVLTPWTAIAVIVGVQLFEAFIDPVLRNPWNTVQQRSQVLMQRNMFAAVLRGYGRHGLRESVGESISRFRDDPRTTADTLDGLADLIGRSIFAVVAAVVMWRIDPLLTMVLFVPILASSFVAQALGDRIMKYQAASRAATSGLTGFLGELMGAQLAVKVSGGAEHAVARLAEMGDARRRLAVRNSVFGEALESTYTHLVNVATGFVLLLGARAIRNGTFTVGDFVLFVVFLDQLMFLPAEIGRVFNGLQRTDVSMRRMATLLPSEPPSALFTSAPIYLRGDLPELPPPPPHERLEHVEVRGLTCAHRDGTRGVIDASFKVERGSFTVITGRIGAGKSTLVHALLGLLPAEAGEIRWNDTIVTDPAEFFVPPRSAYTPQVPRLFSETLRENLLLGLADDAAALDAAVRAAVMEPDVAVLERGLDTLIGPRGVKLSGGQVQRAAAARMFVRDAELLVFDDLSSALDTETEAELWTRLFARGRDVTCLVVSHRPAALRRADQVLLMDAGRVVDHGTLENLLATSPDMRRLWDHERYA